jgi:hypothetical protein
MNDNNENIFWSSLKNALFVFFTMLGILFSILIIHIMATSVDKPTYNIINHAISKLDEIKSIVHVINLIK